MKTTIFDNIELSQNNEKTKRILKNQAGKLIDNNFPVLFTETQVVQLFNLSEKFSVNNNLRKYSIIKNDGNFREIYQPLPLLKTIQKWILKEILDKISISSCAHAYSKGKSIFSNAKVHYYEGKDSWLFATDIVDFFGSIPKSKVKEIFTECGYSENVSNLLANYCTVNGYVAQGFPTSPAISNIIFRDLDNLFQKTAGNYGFRYSRYADDIFISGKINTQKNLKKMENIICFSVNENGFNLNNKKSRFIDLYEEKKITGLMVTPNGVFIPQRIKRAISKDIYYCEKYGVDSHLAYTNNLEKANFKGYLYGYVNFIRMVEPEFGNKLLHRLRKINF